MPPPTGLAGRGFVLYRDLSGIEGQDLDELIARQVRVFAGAERALRMEVAWPRPAGGPAAAAARRGIRARGDGDDRDRARHRDRQGRASSLPDGVSLREVTKPQRLRTDRFTRAGSVERRGRPRMGRRHARDPSVPSTRARLPSSWRRPVQERRLRRPGSGCERGTRTSRPSGAVRTLPEWRRRGIYLGYGGPSGEPGRRAGLSAFSKRTPRDDSRPILERLGFTAVTTTTPWVWSPPTVPGGP